MVILDKLIIDNIDGYCKLIDTEDRQHIGYCIEIDKQINGYCTYVDGYIR
jgi:hypothetical protein